MKFIDGYIVITNRKIEAKDGKTNPPLNKSYADIM